MSGRVKKSVLIFHPGKRSVYSVKEGDLHKARLVRKENREEEKERTSRKLRKERKSRINSTKKRRAKRTREREWGEKGGDGRETIMQRGSNKKSGAVSYRGLKMWDVP